MLLACILKAKESDALVKPPPCIGAKILNTAVVDAFMYASASQVALVLNIDKSLASAEAVPITSPETLNIDKSDA